VSLRGGEADDRSFARTATAKQAARGDWPERRGTHARQFARGFERARARAPPRRERCRSAEIDSPSMMQVCRAGCWPRFSPLARNGALAATSMLD